MKKIIRNRIYDTEKAVEISSFEPFADRGNFRWWKEILYRTEKGHWFIYGQGGALSKYGVALGAGSWGGGSEIETISQAGACEWLKKYDTEKAIELFPEELEEA